MGGRRRPSIVSADIPALEDELARLGQRSSTFDWSPKFQDMQRALKVEPIKIYRYPGLVSPNDFEVQNAYNALQDNYLGAHAPTVFRKLEADDRQRIASLNQRYQAVLATLLRKKVAQGELPSQYLEFLRGGANVPGRTLERIKSGELPMDDASRAKRAIEIGLDPSRTVYRIDREGKDEFLGRGRAGLSYFGFDPGLSRLANQTNGAQIYAGWTSAAGLPQNRPDRRLLAAAAKDAARIYVPFGDGGWSRSGVTPEAVRGRFISFDPENVVVEGQLPFVGGEANFSRGWGAVEEKHRAWKRAHRNALPTTRSRQDGLVRDEAGISMATSTGPVFRSKGLAVIDPKLAKSRNIFYSPLLGSLLLDREEQ